MPHRFPFGSHTTEDTAPEEVPRKRLRRSSLLRRPLNLWKRQFAEPTSVADAIPHIPAPAELLKEPEYFNQRENVPDHVPISKRIIPSLPRPQTFRRQESERRERLREVEYTSAERRTLSSDRTRGRGHSASAAPRTTPRALSPPLLSNTSYSAPDVTHNHQYDHVQSDTRFPPDLNPPIFGLNLFGIPPLHMPMDTEEDLNIDGDEELEDVQMDQASLVAEHDRRWILNLSMHFRDNSAREKFFVTYAEKPNQWRRITISLDYRNAPEDSLEADLSTLHYQRDKSLRIYEAIRDSLPDIQYYDTVTNLKLETTAEDGQLHVHVREDANEIIQYPTISLFDHIGCPRFSETQLQFESHLSGFVYKVHLADRLIIKKEIPGPDTVDEFLYEVNALDSLIGSEHVIQLEGLVTDDRGELVKGLLISYAAQGALVDMIYDLRDSPSLPWHRREKWAKQIVSGLADIHEAGYVQGDFTLSNIVVDHEDNAKIIDINRRGCPVGWEPPCLSRLIDSGQRISMHIGVKTDLFQLGMVLWALAEEVDEPERVERPLPEVHDQVPDYYRQMVRICLSERPQGRQNAIQLLGRFPSSAGQEPSRRTPIDLDRISLSDRSASCTGRRPRKQYIDPDMAVTIEDVKAHKAMDGHFPRFEENAVTYLDRVSNPGSTTDRFESSGSWTAEWKRHSRSRGRSPVSSRRRRSSPFPYERAPSSATSISELSLNKMHQSPHGSDAGDVQNPKRDDSKLAMPHGDEGAEMTGAPYEVDESFAAAFQLLHMDSGFDELMMMDALSLAESQTTVAPPGSRRHSARSEPVTSQSPTFWQANKSEMDALEKEGVTNNEGGAFVPVT